MSHDRIRYTRNDLGSRAGDFQPPSAKNLTDDSGEGDSGHIGTHKVALHDR